MRVHGDKQFIRIRAQMQQSDACAGPAHPTEQARLPVRYPSTRAHPPDLPPDPPAPPPPQLGPCLNLPRASPPAPLHAPGLCSDSQLQLVCGEARAERASPSGPLQPSTRPVLDTGLLIQYKSAIRAYMKAKMHALSLRASSY